MKIDIEEITNGWLVLLNPGPSAGDPLNQREVRAFAYTPEEIAKVTSEWILSECEEKK